MPLNLLKIPRPVCEKVFLAKEEWRIFLYEEYLDHFKNEEEEMFPEVLSLLESHLVHKFERNFRLQLPIRSVPFLVGFLFDLNEIVITSARMNRELFLIQEIGKLPAVNTLNEEQIEELDLLKNHLLKMQSIDVNVSPTVIEQITHRFRLPNFFGDKKLDFVCERGEELEEGLLAEMGSYRPKLLERLSDFFLGLTASYPFFRVHILKFIALLPSLEHKKGKGELKKILLETLERLLENTRRNPKKPEGGNPFPLYLKLLFSSALFFSRQAPAFLLAPLVRFKVRFMAKRFLVGESIEKIERALKELSKTGRDVTLDQLGEKVVSNREADKYAKDVLKLIKGFSLHFQKGERNSAGLPKAHISIKVSALCPDFNPHALEYVYSQAAPRLKEILITAKKENVFVQIDAEQYSYRDLVFYLYKRVLLETEELKDYSDTGIVIQAYLRDAYQHFQEVLALSRERKIRMPVRLVKGAYWDAETIDAAAKGFDPPQFLNKEETDIHFRQLIYKILKAKEDLQLCLGSHNVSDHCFAQALRQQIFPESPPMEHQCLHRTYEALSTGMAKKGWAVRNYVTIGGLLAGMAYLVRRIMENSSQVGILAISRRNKGNLKVKPPQAIHRMKKGAGEIARDPSITELKAGFMNTIPMRLYLKEERNWLDLAFHEFSETELGKNNSREDYSGPLKDVLSPSDPQLVVGKIQLATEEDAGQVVIRVGSGYKNGYWSRIFPVERISVLLKAADQMLLNRLTLASLIVHEGGKNFEESIADVNEAIDFLNFYARQEGRLNAKNKHLVSRGVFAVISPWNFPLAIPCGMAASALAAGNSVILKPAEPTPLITQKLVYLLKDAGVPEDALVHLPGPGSKVGKLLVEHKGIHGVVFTGSKDVGMWIAHTVGKRVVHNGLFNFKSPAKVITEMGGKNAIIVTANAELDETVVGILYSAFGNAGQKCSAASRVLVDEAIKDQLAQRLKTAIQDLPVGPAGEHSTYINPLISLKEKERLQRAGQEVIEEARRLGGKVLIDRTEESLKGCCMGPLLVELPKEAGLLRESFAQKELFGPILHLMGFGNLDEAVRIFNSTEYALTGGIFSQSDEDIAYLQRHLQAGNIYVNRHCTGARVAIEPFGGFKLSGTGPKAGSRVYLEAFHVDLSSREGRREPGLLIDKEGIQKYKMLILNHLRDYVRNRYWNKKIPGQISFNDLSQIKEKGVYVAWGDQPEIKTFFYFLAALAVGAHVTILCQTDPVLKSWSAIARILKEMGFSGKDFSVELVDLEKIKQILHDGELSFLIVEGDSSKVEHILGDLYNGTFTERHMKTVLTRLDAPNIQDFEKYLEPFVQVRSIAINTMRYGAPLEL